MMTKNTELEIIIEFFNKKAFNRKIESIGKKLCEKYKDTLERLANK